MDTITDTLNADLRNLARSMFNAEEARVHWMALSCAGIRQDDIVHATKDIPGLERIARRLGFSCVPVWNGASVVIIHRPKEPDLLARIAKLPQGARLLVYNDEGDIDEMMDRTFDLAIACIFDRVTKKVIRVFDALEPEKGDSKNRKRLKVDSYIDVELGEINDSSLAIHASRIAALR